MRELYTGGGGTGHPKGLDAPKPTSSVRMIRTLGAPFGAWTSFGKSLTDSFVVRPIFPPNGCSGRGKACRAPAVTDAPNRRAASTPTSGAAKTSLGQVIFTPVSFPSSPAVITSPAREWDKIQ